MPHQHFPLRSGGPRQLAVRWLKNGTNVRVEMEGRNLASYGSVQELTGGAQIALGPDSWMRVRWVPTAESFRIDLNGLAVRGATEPYPDIEDAGSAVMGIGILNVVAGVIAILQFGGQFVDGVVIGLIFIVLAMFVRRGSAVALGVAIGLLGIGIVLKIVLMAILQPAPTLLVGSIAGVVLYLSCEFVMVRAYLSATQKA